MTVKVMVVDDSGFFRRRICEILSADKRLKIVGTAGNGREAIDLALKLKPDVITMDYEMPVMDGVTALKEIQKNAPIPVLMFSSLTFDGAKVTLDALDAGAIDFMPKNFEHVSQGNKKFISILIDKIIAAAKGHVFSVSSTGAMASKISASKNEASTASPSVTETTIARRPAIKNTQAKSRPVTKNKKTLAKNTKVVVIGTSTGGPVALQKVLTQLPANFPLPVVVIQHMPGSFTPAFAQRLNQLCKISVKEAQTGDALMPGRALIAPGGQQLMLEHKGSGSVKIIPGDERMNYKPSVDIAFASAAKHFPGKCLGIVLTGMGSDGCEGAKLLKATGCKLWAQDEASSVIYGMPMAVARAKLTDEILPLADFSVRLVEEVS